MLWLIGGLTSVLCSLSFFGAALLLCVLVFRAVLNEMRRLQDEARNGR
jgi:hypothetical protein